MDPNEEANMRPNEEADMDSNDDADVDPNDDADMDPNDEADGDSNNEDDLDSDEADGDPDYEIDMEAKEYALTEAKSLLEFVWGVQSSFRGPIGGTGPKLDSEQLVETLGYIICSTDGYQWPKLFNNVQNWIRNQAHQAQIMVNNGNVYNTVLRAKFANLDSQVPPSAPRSYPTGNGTNVIAIPSSRSPVSLTLFTRPSNNFIQNSLEPALYGARVRPYWSAARFKVFSQPRENQAPQQVPPCSSRSYPSAERNSSFQDHDQPAEPRMPRSGISNERPSQRRFPNSSTSAFQNSARRVIGNSSLQDDDIEILTPNEPVLPRSMVSNAGPSQQHVPNSSTIAIQNPARNAEPNSSLHDDDIEILTPPVSGMSRSAISNAGPSISNAGPSISNAGPSISNAGPSISNAGPSQKRILNSSTAAIQNPARIDSQAQAVCNPMPGSSTQSGQQYVMRGFNQDHPRPAPYTVRSGANSAAAYANFPSQLTENRIPAPYNVRAGHYSASARANPPVQLTANRVLPPNPRIPAVDDRLLVVADHNNVLVSDVYLETTDFIEAAFGALTNHDVDQSNILQPNLLLSDRQIAMMPREQQYSIQQMKNKLNEILSFF